MSDDQLEAALRRVTAEPPVDEDAARIVAQLALPAQKRPWLPAALLDWNFAPAWPRIAALASAAVLGIVIGGSSVGTRIAADFNPVRVATADDSTVLDTDTVTGVRP